MTIPIEVCTENGEWLVGSLDLGCGYVGLHTATHWTARSRPHQSAHRSHWQTGEFWLTVLNLLMGRYLKIGIHKFIFRGGLTIMHFSENGNIKGKGPKPPFKWVHKHVRTKVDFASSIQIMDRFAFPRILEFWSLFTVWNFLF